VHERSARLTTIHLCSAVQVQVSAGHMAKSPGNRRAVSSCSKALSGLRLHLPTRRPVSPVLVFERRPPCLSHPLTASQPSSCCAACCTAHRPSSSLSHDRSQPRLILPYLLASPCHACLPACLTCLLLVQTSAQAPRSGSRKYRSTRHAWIGERGFVYMSTCGAVSFRLGRCQLSTSHGGGKGGDRE
jgi:hypothetical protein